MHTIAEGVEEERDATFLREAGCDFVQGYFYSEPVPAADLPALLRRLRPEASGRALG